MPTYHEALAHCLKENRLRLDLSQSALAQKAGLDRTFISLLERAQRSPTLETLILITKVLKTTPAQFLSECESYRTRGRRRGRIPRASRL